MRRQAVRIEDGDLGDGDLGDEDELALDESIGELLDGPSELWHRQGDPDTTREMLAGVIEMLDEFEANESDSGDSRR